MMTLYKAIDAPQMVPAQRLQPPRNSLHMRSKGAMLIYSPMQNDHSADAKSVGRISRPIFRKCVANHGSGN